MKRRYKKQYKPIKHFTAKFILTLVISMICGLLPVYLFGGQAVILAMATSLSSTGICMLVFGLIQECK